MDLVVINDGMSSDGNKISIQSIDCDVGQILVGVDVSTAGSKKLWITSLRIQQEILLKISALLNEKVPITDISAVYVAPGFEMVDSILGQYGRAHEYLQNVEDAQYILFQRGCLVAEMNEHLHWLLFLDPLNIEKFSRSDALLLAPFFIWVDSMLTCDNAARIENLRNCSIGLNNDLSMPQSKDIVDDSNFDDKFAGASESQCRILHPRDAKERSMQFHSIRFADDATESKWFEHLRSTSSGGRKHVLDNLAKTWISKGSPEFSHHRLKEMIEWGGHYFTLNQRSRLLESTLACETATVREAMHSSSIVSSLSTLQKDTWPLTQVAMLMAVKLIIDNLRLVAWEKLKESNLWAFLVSDLFLDENVFADDLSFNELRGLSLVQICWLSLRDSIFGVLFSVCEWGIRRQVVRGGPEPQPLHEIVIRTVLSVFQPSRRYRQKSSYFFLVRQTIAWLCSVHDLLSRHQQHLPSTIWASVFDLLKWLLAGPELPSASPLLRPCISDILELIQALAENTTFSNWLSEISKAGKENIAANRPMEFLTFLLLNNTTAPGGISIACKLLKSCCKCTAKWSAVKDDMAGHILDKVWRGLQLSAWVGNLTLVDMALKQLTEYLWAHTDEDFYYDMQSAFDPSQLIVSLILVANRSEQVNSTVAYADFPLALRALCDECATEQERANFILKWQTLRAANINRSSSLSSCSCVFRGLALLTFVVSGQEGKRDQLQQALLMYGGAIVGSSLPSADTKLLLRLLISSGCIDDLERRTVCEQILHHLFTGSHFRYPESSYYHAAPPTTVTPLAQPVSLPLSMVFNPAVLPSLFGLIEFCERDIQTNILMKFRGFVEQQNECDVSHLVYLAEFSKPCAGSSLFDILLDTTFSTLDPDLQDILFSTLETVGKCSLSVANLRHMLRCCGLAVSKTSAVTIRNPKRSGGGSEGAGERGRRGGEKEGVRNGEEAEGGVLGSVKGKCVVALRDEELREGLDQADSLQDDGPVNSSTVSNSTVNNSTVNSSTVNKSVSQAPQSVPVAESAGFGETESSDSELATSVDMNVRHMKVNTRLALLSTIDILILLSISGHLLHNE